MTYSLEHEIIKEGDAPVSPPQFSWEKVVIGIDNIDELEGFRVRSRAVNNTEIGGPQYPEWEIIEQTITISIPDCGVQTYGGIGAQYAGAQWSEGGIVDGSGYIYTKVFDQSRFKYLPAFSGDTQDNFTGELDAEQGFPEEPFDPENDVYPMDAITSYLPDQRPSVIVTYTVDTEFKVYTLDLIGIQGPQGGQGDQGIIDPGFQGPQVIPITLTDSITIYHEVAQPVHDWAAQLHALQQKTYFYNSLYH